MKFEDKMNDRVRITSKKGEIVRTKEDFYILEENLLFQQSGLLIPKIGKHGHQKWLETLLDYNKNANENQMINNFLKNEEFYLTNKKSKIVKNVMSYIDKLDYLWTQNIEYHKSRNKRREFRRQANRGKLKSFGKEIPRLLRNYECDSDQTQRTNIEVQFLARIVEQVSLELRVPSGRSTEKPVVLCQFLRFRNKQQRVVRIGEDLAGSGRYRLFF